MLEKIQQLKFPLILDGGLSNELEAQGHDLGHSLWSAKLLETEPEAIIKAHLAYLEAGAQCIITASYQASIRGFLETGYTRAKAEQLLALTVTLAEEAIKIYQQTNKTDNQPFIAASIGPYGAYLSDGSEYRGNYAITNTELTTFHRERLQILGETSADFFACETIPSYREAKILGDLLKEATKPAWITFSCKDDVHICDGTKIQEAVALFHDHPTIFAVGINCTAPKYISRLIKALKPEIGDKKLIIYPNAGMIYHPTTKTWHGTDSPQVFAKLTKEWISLGVDIVGGCCQIGPKHIEKVINSIQLDND